MFSKNRIITGTIAVSAIMGVLSPQLAYANTHKDRGEYTIIDEGSGGNTAEDSNGITWYYNNLKNGTIEIGGTHDLSSYLEVPETLDGKKVSVIGAVALAGPPDNQNREQRRNIVKKVKLPQTVKMIDDDAFMDCKALTDVEMPENVTVSETAFSACPNVRINGELTSYNVPRNTNDLKIGWNQLGNNKFYVVSGVGFQTGWANLDGKRYYFYGNGQMATGFINLGNDSIYYLDTIDSGSNSGNLVTGWKKVNGTWYYFNPTGKSGKEKGYMQTGWFYNNGSWYYFYGSGEMATGFINLGGDAYYYLDESNSSSVGIMKTGWQYISGKWYYFNRYSSEGVVGMMKKGWQYIDGYWYYFYYGDGTMAHDAWIDGYYVNSSGAWS